MVEAVEFVVGDVGPTPEDVLVVAGMRQAACLHAGQFSARVRFDLTTPPSLDSPLFAHRVHGLDLLTNDTAGFLARTATKVSFVAREGRADYLVRSETIADAETEILEAAASTLGPGFLQVLADQRKILQARRAHRLQMLRCVVSQMERTRELDPLSTRLRAALASTHLPRMKHTGLPRPRLEVEGHVG